MAQTRIGGIFFLKIDGRQYETSGEATINLGQNMRKAKLGTTRAVGFIEEPQTPKFDCTILLTSELSLQDITSIQEATIQLVAPNGATYVLRDAYFAGEGEYTTGEGEVSAVFEGTQMEVIGAA